MAWQRPLAALTPHHGPATQPGHRAAGSEHGSQGGRGLELRQASLLAARASREACGRGCIWPETKTPGGPRRVTETVLLAEDLSESSSRADSSKLGCGPWEAALLPGCPSLSVSSFGVPPKASGP